VLRARARATRARPWALPWLGPLEELGRVGLEVFGWRAVASSSSRRPDPWRGAVVG